MNFIKEYDLTRIIYDLSGQWLAGVSSIIYDYLDDIEYYYHIIRMLWFHFRDIRKEIYFYIKLDYNDYMQMIYIKKKNKR